MKNRDELRLRKSTEQIDYVDIGKRIQQKRKAAGLTQENMAALVDLDTSTISKIETGSTKISLPSLVEIANLLHVSADELLCGSIAASAYVYQSELVEQMKDCDEKELRILSEVNAVLLEQLRK